MELTINDAFYIQEDFVSSLAKDGRQLLTLYFFATIKDLHNLEIIDKNIQEINWIPLSANNPFTLPVDRTVFNKLQLKLS